MRTYKNIYIKTALFILKSKHNQTNIGLYRDQSSVLERRRTLELNITKNQFNAPCHRRNTLFRYF